MQIQLVCVGRLKGAFAYINEGVADYLDRIKPYAKVSLVEVPDEAILPSKTPEQIMDREAERLLPYIERSSYAIALSERGELLSSEAFSRVFFDRVTGYQANPNQPNGGIRPTGGGPIIFIVGGALGLSPQVLNRCQWILSLSPMTFPHPLARLMIAEQLYRAFKIQRNEPYHK